MATCPTGAIRIDDDDDDSDDYDHREFMTSYDIKFKSVIKQVVCNFAIEQIAVNRMPKNMQV